MLVVITEMRIIISHSISLPTRILRGNQSMVLMYGNVDTTKTFWKVACWAQIRFEPLAIGDPVESSIPSPSAKFNNP